MNMNSILASSSTSSSSPCSRFCSLVGGVGFGIGRKRSHKFPFRKGKHLLITNQANDVVLQRNSNSNNGHGGDDGIAPSIRTRRREASMLLTSVLFHAAASGGITLAPLPSLAQAKEESKKSTCELTVAPSGLAFCDTVVGTGSAATKGQLIKAHYTGKLENGNVFDSSYLRGRPLTFRVGVGEVIKGWDEGILGGDSIPPMFVGGRRTLKLPPELGYGMRGAGCKGGSCIISPGSTLFFDIEFVGSIS